MRTSHLAFLVLLAACGTAKAPVVVVRVPQTVDTLVLPGIIQVSHAAPLSNGRWAILALQNSEVFLVDFTTKQVSPFPGMTKAEVPRPTVLFGIADTIVVGDLGLQRFTRWTAGQPRLDAIPVNQALRGSQPRAHDAAGNWYFQIPPRAGIDEKGKLDSTVIIRANALLSQFDTVAMLAPPDMAAIEDGTGRVYVRRALSGDDRWGVRPDGTVWIARHHQNRIDLFPVSGKPTRGKHLPDPVLTLSDMDKEIFIRRYPADQQDPARQSTPWSPIKPPFESAYALPDNRYWLFKSAPALDSIRKFQVVEPDGVRLIVEVPSRGSALSVSPDAILMAEEFPGGIRLLRYLMPPEAIAKNP